MRAVVATTLLAAVAALALIASAALIVVRDALDRLHLVTLAATPAMLALVAAVFVAEGLGRVAVTTLLIGATVTVTSAVVASATARAVRGARTDRPDDAAWSR